LKFTKMHGLGNDFIVIEDLALSLRKTDRLARRLCHRNYGIGADGLVLLQPSERALCRMRIINSDGSEAEMCGNALRCVGKYLYEKGMTQKTVFPLEVQSGIKTISLLTAGHTVSAVQVDMGEPVLESRLIPVCGENRRVIGEQISAAGCDFLMTAVSMGNPHCVIFRTDLTALPLDVWGPALEEHELFPKKSNVHFVEVLSPREARLLVWERGAGPTLACGSGACAVLVAGVLNGKLERQATVHLPGGTLFVEWRGDNHVYMTGPAQEVFRGELSGVNDYQEDNREQGE